MLYFVQTQCGRNAFVEAPVGIDREIHYRFGSLLGCRECAQVSDAYEGDGVPDYRVDADGTIWSREPWPLREIL